MGEDGGARRVLRVLLRLYPAGFRRELGDDLVETAVHRWRDATRGRRVRGAAAFWCTEGVRFAVDGAAERWRSVPVRMGEVASAWRQLRRAPGLHLVGIGTLALGIGATTTIFTAADAVVFRPLPYADADALVLVHARFGATELSSNSLPNARDLEASVRTLSWLAAAHDASPALTDATDEAERVPALYVTSDYLPGLGGRVVAGRPFVASDYTAGAARVAIVSAGVALRRWGGAAAALDRDIGLDGALYRVVGVMAESFRDPAPIESGAVTAVWLPARDGDGAFAHRDAYWFRLIGRMAPGVSREDAARDLSAAGRRLARAHPAENTVDGDSLDFVVHPLHEATVGGARGRLLLLLGAVMLLLVLACANVASLAVARGIARAPELAVRRALGATGARLAVQLFAENLWTAALAGVLGGLLGFGGLRLFLAAAPAGTPRLHEVGLDARVFLSVAALTLLVGLVFGILPAVRSARATAATTPAARTTTSRHTQRLEFALVAIEVAIAFVLVTASALLLNSIARTLRVHPGFDGEDVLVVDVRPPHTARDIAAEERFHRALLEGARALPGVAAAGMMYTAPGLTGGGWTQVTVDPERATAARGERSRAPAYGGTPGDDFFRINPVFGDALDVLDIQLRAGRRLTGTEGAGDAPVVVLNEAAARRFFPDDPEPIGRRLALGTPGSDAPMREVVGIVGDVLQRGPAHAPDPQLYLPYGQRPVARLTLLLELRPGAAVSAETVRRMVDEVAPDVPVDLVAPLRERYAAASADAAFLAFLLSALAAIGLALAAVGTLATVSHAVSLRVRELGIRAALGARTGNAVWLVLSLALRTAGAGIAAGAAVTLAGGRVLEAHVFGIGPRDPATLLASAALIVACAVLASLAPALRAARVDPNEVLRSG